MISVSVYGNSIFAQEWQIAMQSRIDAEKLELSRLGRAILAHKEAMGLFQEKELNSELALTHEKGVLHQLENDLKAAQIERNGIVDDIATASSRPKLVTARRLNELQVENLRLTNRIEEIQNNIHKQRNKSAAASVVLSTVRDELADANRQLAVLGGRYANLAASQIVIIRARGFCAVSPNKTIQECKDLAIREAELKAIELGGHLIIDSVTQTVNFRVLRDKIVAKRSAKIVHQDRLGGPIYERDFGEFGAFRVEIVAAVQNIPSEMPTVGGWLVPQETIEEIKEARIARRLVAGVSGLIAVYSAVEYVNAIRADKRAKSRADTDPSRSQEFEAERDRHAMSATIGGLVSAVGITWLLYSMNWEVEEGMDAVGVVPYFKWQTSRGEVGGIALSIRW